MGRLDGKVAIVTGAGGGIGRAMVVRFAQEGAQVVAADIDEERVAETAEVARRHGDVAHRRVDVSQPDEVRGLVEAAVGRYEKLTTMCNNAAISIPGRRHRGLGRGLRPHDRRQPSRSLPRLQVRRARPVRGGRWRDRQHRVREQPRRRAVSLGLLRVEGRRADALEGHPLDYADKGIRCNCLCPGWVDTPINHPHAERMGGLNSVLESLPEWQPIGRQGFPEEIAAAAVYLASDESAFMTGSAFVIDGAMTAR